MGIKMNKLTAATFVALTILFGCTTAIDNAWQPTKKYTHSPEFDTALVVAKEWVLNNKQNPIENFVYEYSIRRHKELVEVSVNELTIKSNGDVFSAMDGEVCIYIDNKGRVVNTKQCYAP
jgi:hypothetical protein